MDACLMRVAVMLYCHALVDLCAVCNEDYLSPCAGGCVDYQTDPKNCGDCNISCGFNQKCEGGKC
eukprot:29575-Eustigmatos_ZCMA.PRE.1